MTLYSLFLFPYLNTHLKKKKKKKLRKSIDIGTLEPSIPKLPKCSKNVKTATTPSIDGF